MDERVSLVATGYDAMPETWETWSARVTDDPRGDWLERFEPHDNRRLLSAFDLLDDELVTITEPEGRVRFHWILARR